MKFKYVRRFRKFWYMYNYLYDNLNYHYYMLFKVTDAPMIKAKNYIAKKYQQVTPCFKYCRWLLNNSVGNFGKYLYYDCHSNYQRSRDGSNEYFRLVSILGYIRFYKEEYVDKDDNNINAFINIVIPAICGEDKSDDLTFKKTCLVKGWCFTKKQASRLLREIKESSKSLSWNNMYNNVFNLYDIVELLKSIETNENKDMRDVYLTLIVSELGVYLEKNPNDDLNKIYEVLKSLKEKEKSRKYKSIVNELNYLLEYMKNQPNDFDKQDFIFCK